MAVGSVGAQPSDDYYRVDRRMSGRALDGLSSSCVWSAWDPVAAAPQVLTCATFNVMESNVTGPPGAYTRHLPTIRMAGSLSADATVTATSFE